MGLTQLSFVLLPLCGLYLSQPGRLLQLILVFSVFEAAAALVVGDIGLQPGLAPALVFIGFVILQALLGVSYPGTLMAMKSVFPLAVATAYAVVTSLVMPELFDGAVQVWPQKLAPGLNDVQELHFSFYNLTQDMYLSVNCLIACLTAIYTTRTNFDFRMLRQAYFGGAMLVVLLSLWQLVSRLSGLYFPTDFLHSNPGWMLNGGQELGNVPRIDASFSEPSALALYLCGVAYGCAWAIVKGHKSRFLIVMLGLSLLGVLLSTSTTGFGALGIGSMLLVGYAGISGSAAVVRRVLKLLLPLVFGFLLAAAISLAFFPAVVTAVVQVYSATIDKSETASYQDRTGTDITSLALVGETSGLGVGWGSNRSSSLIPGLLASLGIPGMLLVAWFVFSLIQQIGSARRCASNRNQQLTLDLFGASVLGQLIAACLSAPTITSPEFYTEIGILIGCASRIQVDSASVQRVLTERLRAARSQSGLARQRLQRSDLSKEA